MTTDRTTPLARKAAQHHAAGELSAAAEAYRQLLAEASTAHSYAGLGSVLIDQRAFAEGLAIFESGLSHFPEDRLLAEGRAVCLDRQMQIGAAVAAYQAVLTRHPESDLAWNNLGTLLNRQGRNADALAAFDRARALVPEHKGFQSNVLLALNYSDAFSAQTIAARHREWEQGVPVAAPPRREPSPARRLRVGYVSADFRSHPVAYFIGAVLAAHDREAFEIFCYSAGRETDGLTDTLRGMPLIWRDIAWLDDAASADLIREDSIDILIELGGHTGANRLTLIALRPAPVQITYLGYPNTTGMSAIDYRFTDALADPPGAAEALHSERLLRLDGGFLAYTAPSNMPPVNPLPALEQGQGQVTFGSFTNLAKVSGTTLQLWSQVIKATPDSRLLVKAREFADDDTRAHFLARCEAAGIPAAQLRLQAEPTAAAAHYATWHEVDIALDTFPYNGTTTTCEALWMGVPVVTLAGDRHAARVGASLLHAAGLPQLAAQSPAQFVAITRALAQDLPTVAKLRATLRARLSHTPLMDAQRLTRAIEQHLREVWREWCAQQAP